MLKTQKRWLTTKPTSTMTLKQYNEITETNGCPADPYIIIGAHGYASNNVELVRKAFKAEDAVKKAQEALEIPERWDAATDVVADLTPFEEAVPSHDADSFVVRGALNLPAIADNAVKLAAACSVATMYHDPKSHNSADTLKEMATASSISKPFHIIDHGRIVSRHAIVTCENALDAAAAALELVDTDPHGAAASYQTNIATATVAYSHINKSMVTAELKASRYAVDERIQTTYVDTFPAILKSVSAAYVPAGV